MAMRHELYHDLSGPAGQALLDACTEDHGVAVVGARPAEPAAPAAKPARKRAPSTRPRARKAAAARVITDRATDYARRVLAGDIIAGPHVRAACARHLRDLVEGPARGLKWDVQASEDRIDFFAEVLCLNGGQFEGQPFVLDHWQQFVAGSLQGWKLATTGARRFRQAYIETGKGSGKSPLVAGFGIAGLVADGEDRAEIYAAATKQDQAMVLFRDAVAMYQQSPILREVLTPSGAGEKTWNLSYRPRASFFRAISAENGMSGPRPHIAIIDEVHEHKTSAVVEMLRAGTKSRREALILMITNSGAGKATPCGQYHDYAIRVADGTATDDAFFSYVCALDDGDDPLADEACWPKANPSLQYRNLPGLQYLREQVREARGMPSKQGVVKRLNFCMWTEAVSQWLTAEIWGPCQRDYTADDLRGRRAWAGLDLSSTTDLTGLVLLVEPEHDGEPWCLLPYAWLPSEGLVERSERDRVDYVRWHAEGYLETTPGRAISRSHVVKRLAQIFANFDVQGLAYDRWRMADLKQAAEDEGIELPGPIEFGQGYKHMSPAIEAFETAVLNRQLAHNGHPVLTMCAANAVATQDPAGNRKLDKAKATGRIDLIVSAVMAYGCAAREDRSDATMFFDLNKLAA